jgi:glycosyltransferase involved in cell wall biosynthesis
MASFDVIIPFYNSYETLNDAVDSILQQKLQTVELGRIIIVDDGSFNKLRIDFFDQTAQGLIEIVYKPNGGAASARNLGVCQSKSRYLSFLDSDDRWKSDKIETQIQELARYGAGMCGCASNMSNFINKSQGIVGLKSQLFSNHFQTSTVLIDTFIINREEVYFPESQRFAEEGDLFLRLVGSYPCLYINRVMVDYAGGKAGSGVSGLSANLVEMEKGELLNLARCYKRGQIGLLSLVGYVGFSLVKFLRRIVSRGF